MKIMDKFTKLKTKLIFRNNTKRNQLNTVKANLGKILEKKILNENFCSIGERFRISIFFLAILKAFFSKSVPDNLGKENSFILFNIRSSSIIIIIKLL
jgi:hypothetical protein